LEKIGLCLNWCLPINRDKDPEESQSSNTDSLPSSDGIEDVTGEEENQVVVPGKLTRPWNFALKLILDENSTGQLPVWANTQLQQALDQLFRTNLIK
jgi:cytoskeletal protein RodZ